MNKFVEYILSRLGKAQAAGNLPREIRLATYPSDEVLKFFRPAENWSGGAFEHKAEMLGVAAEIAKRYPTVSVEIVEIDIEGYFDWLKSSGLSDSDVNRAAYISKDD